MESFRIDSSTSRPFEIRVEEVHDASPEMIRTLIDIDLQTFAEATFSPYTLAAFLNAGAVYQLCADDVIIGSCVCFRSWARPHEAMLLSTGIRPGWRGRGLGQRFVSGVLEKLRAKGMRSATLLVGADNRRAVRVYKDVGFEVVSEQHVESRGGTMLLMRCKLRDDAPVELLPGT